MNVKKQYLLALFLFSIVPVFQTHAGLAIKNGWFVDSDDIATSSAEAHYQTAIVSMNRGDWENAAAHFRIVWVNFPTTTIGQESSYYLGVSYYYLEELEHANEAFTQYLSTWNNPRFFEETIGYKFAIAERFRAGEKKRCFGSKQLPKWSCGLSLALNIYDEVIISLPCHELATQSLFAKGTLLWDMRDYRASIEVFQELTKRFPKHELAPESYLAISRIYLELCRIEFQNPDFLAFAQINLRKFQESFPRDERVCEAQGIVAEITEVYAKGFYDTGRFYERVEKPRASIIYYENAIRQFPDTSIAELCRCRLEKLCPNRAAIQSCSE